MMGGSLSFGIATVTHEWAQQPPSALTLYTLICQSRNTHRLPTTSNTALPLACPTSFFLTQGMSAQPGLWQQEKRHSSSSTAAERSSWCWGPDVHTACSWGLSWATSKHPELAGAPKVCPQRLLSFTQKEASLHALRLLCVINGDDLLKLRSSDQNHSDDVDAWLLPWFWNAPAKEKPCLWQSSALGPQETGNITTHDSCGQWCNTLIWTGLNQPWQGNRIWLFKWQKYNFGSLGHMVEVTYVQRKIFTSSKLEMLKHMEHYF